jgi:hypothetical protein
MSGEATARGLLDVQSVVVPYAAVESAYSHLRQVGEDHSEGFALWAGVLEDTTFYVRETIIPRQTAHSTSEGVYVTVDQAEMRRIGRWLYDNGLRLVAQLHSHPGAAYHSDTDDALPIVATVGALSLVIPNFAREVFDLKRCATYRFLPNGGWTIVSTTEASLIISVIDAPDDAATAEPEQAKGQGKSLWRWLHTLIKRH